MDDYDVAVVGGGPVGMWLAAELHRGGVRPVVLERRAERPPYSKALTIYPRTVEQFAMRGLVDRWLAEGTPVPSSHFALMKNRLDFSFLPTRYPFTLFLPQRRTEELLEEHLAELGVPYLRRHAVTGLRQDEVGVELDVDSPGGPMVVRAAYAVGCDGATSVIRAAAGIEFEGTPDTWRTILGDIELADPPQAPALTLNQPGGSMYMVAIGGGRGCGRGGCGAGRIQGEQDEPRGGQETEERGGGGAAQVEVGRPLANQQVLAGWWGLVWRGAVAGWWVADG